jgi:endo-1,4-beta-xylanase
MALAADPTTKLYYNDYNLEYGGAKTQGAIRITKLIQSYGLRIDGVGLQAHMTSESTPTQNTPTPSRANLAAVLNSFTKLNVDVAYTELDIRLNTPANQQKLQANAAAYARMVGSCMDVQRCVGITVWVCTFTCQALCFIITNKSQGISDKYSWVPSTFPGEGSALLWDDNFNKKPSYTSSLNTIRGQ